MAEEPLRGHQPPQCGGMQQPCSIVLSGSQELKQGLADLILPVLLPLAVDEPFSFYSKTLGSRAPRLHPGGVHCGQLYAWTQAP